MEIQQRDRCILAHARAIRSSSRYGMELCSGRPLSLSECEGVHLEISHLWFGPLKFWNALRCQKNDSIVFSAHRCANAFGTFGKTPTLSPQLGSHILTEAPCTEIIQRANSTIDYDLRDQHETLERPAKMARVCPVLWDLYHSDFNKSDTKTVINCNILHLTRVYTGHIKFRVYWQWIAIFGTSSSHMGYESTKCLFIWPHFSFKGLLCLP